MTNTTHTQGPWVAKDHTKRFELLDSDGFPILRINGGMIPTDANARLIAAAPELLEALEALTSLVQGNGNDHITRACNDATKAINKAKGE